MNPTDRTTRRVDSLLKPSRLGRGFFQNKLSHFGQTLVKCLNILLKNQYPIAFLSLPGTFRLTDDQVLRSFYRFLDVKEISTATG